LGDNLGGGEFSAPGEDSSGDLGGVKRAGADRRSVDDENVALMT